MRKNCLYLAIIGLVTGFGAHAEGATENRSREIAMAKCTKSAPQADSDRDASCGSLRCNSCGEDSGSTQNNKDQSNAASEVKCKRKSAAQKVLEGQ